MSASPHSTTDSAVPAVAGVLAALILAVGVWDCLVVGRLCDTFLAPTIDASRAWGELGDWSAAQCYSEDWKTAALRWASGWLPDAVVVAAVVFAVHALLWTGVYYVGRALFRGSPWVAVLGVVLVRVCPDLFQVDLLGIESPSRMAAIALAFWSIGLTIRRRWVTACCAGGFIAHFSPTVACWFVQFIVAAMFCLNHERGWRRSSVGAACFLAIAAGPLVRFLVGEIVPDSPLPDDAMLGLHFFADPALSPLSVPLWCYVCLVVYLAMAFEWMKPHFRRDTTPVAIIFFLIGMAGLLIEIVFVGVVPVERAARFEISNMRAFWLLWIPIFYAPVLAEEIRIAWRSGWLWPAVLRGMLFSLPVAWSTLTLLDRLRRPPRWSVALVGLMLVLLGLSAFVFPRGEQPVAGPLYVLVVAVAVSIAARVSSFFAAGGQIQRAAASLSLAAMAFAVCAAVFAGGSARRALLRVRRTVKQTAAWKDVCRSTAVRESPADSKWSVPWRPRQFRRLTGRAVLVNRSEIPREANRRFEWFQRYAETHGWEWAPGESHGAGDPETLQGRLRDNRRGLGPGGRWNRETSEDWLVVSRAAVQSYGVRYAVCRRGRRPQRQDGERSQGISVERISSEGPFEVYRIEMRAPDS